MTLASGTRLGSYEIVGPLGAGGMGEVYRARDTKLNREVAIKVLLPSVANDADRLARFSREAQVLASLNHPHIAQIFGLEARKGQDGQEGTSFLVMEFVDGEELAQKIGRGPIPLDEALPIAKQIAEALEAAHDQGIIHRDLKPANIKVRPDGTVKVLDFGLAKALNPERRASLSGERDDRQLANSPTITTPAMMTGVGVILGTAAYLAPEQAKGRPADKRSDVWAFGCVLFEMLTAKRAFGGDDVAETLAVVIRGEPAWSAAPDLPPSIATLLRRTLEKDRNRRIAAFSTVRFLLGESHEPVSLPAASPRASMVAIATIVVVMMAIVGVWIVRRPVSDRPRPITRFGVPLPQDASLFVGTNPQRAIALSRDGSRLVFAARVGSRPSQLYVRAFDQLEATPIRGTEGGVLPLLSPDGQWLAYVSSVGGTLNRVPVSGGAPIVICRTNGIRGATWLPDDTIVFADAASGAAWLKRVPSTGGTPVNLTTLDTKSEALHAWPQTLPDGRSIVFSVQRASGVQNATAIVLLRLDTGERRVLVEGGTMPQYLDSGHLVFVRAGTLMAVPFDAQALRVTGAPIPVLDGTVAGVTSSGAQVAISASGTLAYIPGGSLAGSRSMTWVSRQGAVTPATAPRQNYETPRLSPDGAKALVSITGSGTVLRDVWVYDFSRGTLSRLTHEKIEGESAIWTPDGERIVYLVLREAGRQFIARPANGSGGEEVLATTDRHLHTSSWTPDGGTLLSVTANGIDGGTFWALEMKPKPSLRLMMKTSAQLQAPMISPDGRWLAYSSNETDRFEVYVRAFPGPGARYQVSSAGGTEPRWARNGRELFYRKGDDMMAVTVADKGASLQIGPPVKLFEGRFATVGGSNLDAYYDVSPDGRFLMVKADESAGTSGIIVVQNWQDELKRLAAAR